MCNELVNEIKKLREALSPDGEYSIKRKDGQSMGLGDALYLGEIMRKIDEILDNLDEV